MISKEIVVQNEVGLHARPATFFIQKANEFKSLITIARDDRKVNAKSLLGVLSLGITKGTKVILTAEGPDEQESIDELNNLIMSNFTDIE
jgi:phosphocarrier protein